MNDLLVKDNGLVVKDHGLVVGPCPECCGECGTLCCGNNSTPARPWMRCGWPAATTPGFYRFRFQGSASLSFEAFLQEVNIGGDNYNVSGSSLLDMNASIEQPFAPTNCPTNITHLVRGPAFETGEGFRFALACEVQWQPGITVASPNCTPPSPFPSNTTWNARSGIPAGLLFAGGPIIRLALQTAATGSTVFSDVATQVVNVGICDEPAGCPPTRPPIAPHYATCLTSPTRAPLASSFGFDPPIQFSQALDPGSTTPIFHPTARCGRGASGSFSSLVTYDSSMFAGGGRSRMGFAGSFNVEVLVEPCCSSGGDSLGDPSALDAALDGDIRLRMGQPCRGCGG